MNLEDKFIFYAVIDTAKENQVLFLLLTRKSARDVLSSQKKNETLRVRRAKGFLFNK